MSGNICIKDIWDKTCGTLKEFSFNAYEQWFQNIVPLSIRDNEIVLGVSDDFFADWLMTNYEDILSEALEKSAKRKLSIKFETGYLPEEKIEEIKPEYRMGTDDTEDLSWKYAVNPNCLSRHNFSNFVVGEENRYAHAAAITAARSPGLYNPLYIYGGTGLGKTHLLQAVANEILQNSRQGTIVEYITCEGFLNLYVDSLQQRRHSEFRNRFRGADVLLVDDVHQLANKTQLQEEFFNTFNTLYNRNKQIIMTSDKRPCEIKGLEDRLVSRFESGVATEITAPCLETRIAILRMKQQEHIIKLDDEILFFIASKISTSVRHLEGALLRLVAYSSAMSNCRITIELAEKLLSNLIDEEIAAKKVSIEQIQKKVAEHFSIHVHDILGNRRPNNIAKPRMIAMYLSRKMTSRSFPEIAEAFGGKNHATVINAVKKVSALCKDNDETKRTVEFLRRQIQE